MKTKKTTELLTITEAAEMLGKSRQGLSRTLKRHGVTPGTDGRFDAAKVFEAARAGAMMDKNALSQSGGAAEGLQRQKVEQQIRLLTAQASRAAFELSRLRGRHVSMEEHRAEVLTICQWCRRTIDVWVKTTAAEFGDVTTKRKLEDAQRKAFAAIQSEFEAAYGTSEK